jgi:hypothetical protein
VDGEDVDSSGEHHDDFHMSLLYWSDLGRVQVLVASFIRLLDRDHGGGRGRDRESCLDDKTGLEQRY